MTEDQLSQFARRCWPAEWSGRRFVNLDNVGSPGEWLGQRVVEPSLDVLTEGEIRDDEPLAADLKEDYLVALEEHAISPPWEFGDDPDDPKWVAECEEEIRKEFVAFLRAWREKVKAYQDS